jgi:hypothetical protein
LLLKRDHRFGAALLHVSEHFHKEVTCVGGDGGGDVVNGVCCICASASGCTLTCFSQLEIPDFSSAYSETQQLIVQCEVISNRCVKCASRFPSRPFSALIKVPSADSGPGSPVLGIQIMRGCSSGGGLCTLALSRQHTQLFVELL